MIVSYTSARDQPAVRCQELDFSQNSQGETICTKRLFLYIQQDFLTQHMLVNSMEMVKPHDYSIYDWYCIQTFIS